MKDKLIVITGGSFGIGRSLVHSLSAEGNTVVYADKRPSGLDKGIHLMADLGDEADTESFKEKVLSQHGIPDVLIFCAGRGIHQRLSEGNVEQWKEIFQLNVFSTLHLLRGFLPFMLERGSGDVVFISSVSAGKPYPYGGIYCASKAAINTIAETLRLEAQPMIRVITIAPGVVDTDFFENIIDGPQTADNIGWGSVHPEEVADTVCFALSQRPDVSLNNIVIRPTAQPL